MRLAEAVTVAWCLNMGVTEEVPIPGQPQRRPSPAHTRPTGGWLWGMSWELTRGLGLGTRSQLTCQIGMHAIDTKWLFGHKRDSEGRIVEVQRPGLWLGGSLRSMAWTLMRHTPVWPGGGPSGHCLALSAVHGWAVQVADVNNAFLNAPLAEEVYIKIPEGLEGPRGKVLRLRMALYGLRQAPRSWERELGQFLERLGFRKSLTDNALYYRYSKDGTFIFVPVYVDDLMVVAKNNETIQAFLGDLRSGYKIKELGNISVYLGVQVERDLAAKTCLLGCTSTSRLWRASSRTCCMPRGQAAGAPGVP